MTNEEFLQQFGHFIDAPNGIQKLRELILQLAVQGKLVPQDSRDEAASVLIRKINEKKTQLVKEKIIKKEKRLPQVIIDDVPFRLPNNWEWSRLGEVTNYGSTDKAEASDVENSTWVLELEDVEKATSRLLRRSNFSERKFKSSKNRFKKGDVIYGKLRPYLDKVITADQDGVCTTEMIPIRGYFGIMPEYLRWYLKSPFFIAYANSSTHGMNLPRMGTEKGRLAVFPLPPLAEQHRIVAKVDELMSLCDRLEAERKARAETHQRLIRAVHHPLTEAGDTFATQIAWRRIRDNFTDLYTTLESVQALRQTILQLAVQGKLLSQDPNDEPVEKLFDRIKTEQDELIRSGKTKIYKYQKTKSSELGLFTIPVQWIWAYLGELLVFGPRNGYSPKSVEYPTSVKTLTLTAITRGKFDGDQFKYLDIEVEKSSYLWLHHGDILMQRANSLEYVGISAIFDGIEGEYIYPDLIMKMRTSNEINVSYLHLVLSSLYAREFMRARTTGTSGSMPKINQQTVNSLPVPLPPRAEQQRIVDKVDELMTLCNQLDANIRAKSETANRYAEAIVNRITAA